MSPRRISGGPRGPGANDWPAWAWTARTGPRSITSWPDARSSAMAASRFLAVGWLALALGLQSQRAEQVLAGRPVLARLEELIQAPARFRKQVPGLVE